jgi:Domain of unknown function (DUF222)
MGGGGRGERLADEMAGRRVGGSADAGAGERSLLGPPGEALAGAVEAAADPVLGVWPVGTLPSDDSTEPWRQAIHAVVAARRLAGWALWAQLSMVARLLIAWQVAPPVSNSTTAEDRCESADPELTERLNKEIIRTQRSVRGQWEGLAAEMAPEFVSVELALAAGLSRLMSDRHVEAAQALFITERLPRLRRLLRWGWVDWYKLDAFVQGTWSLEPVLARAVERIVLGDLDPDESIDVLADPTQPGLGLPPIVRMTVPELRTAIAAAIAAIDAEAAARRAKNARAARRVRCQATLDGTATVTAELTVEAAAAVWNALTATARAARAAGDPRSLDQLRADALLAHTTGTSLPPPVPGDTFDVPDETDCDAPSNGKVSDSARTDAESAHGGGAKDDGAETAGSGACHACGQEPRRARTRKPGRPMTVSLTLPLATYLGLAKHPGQLDGYGPVAAGLARQIIRDAERGEAAGSSAITWRCVIVDDAHGTVVGVGAPIHVPRHDPPSRLAELVRSSEPTCCFPGCRLRARDCDLDHRIPYDPDDPLGSRGGGPTCSCNLQPACRTHHRLKTAGLIDVRVVPDSEDPSVSPGTLEFTTATGLRYRRAPSRATPPPPELDDVDIAVAFAHADLRAARDADDEARMDATFAAKETERATADDGAAGPAEEYDGEDRAWRRSQAEYTRRRVLEAAQHAARAHVELLDSPF